jgi:hypothetical protein
LKELDDLDNLLKVSPSKFSQIHRETEQQSPEPDFISIPETGKMEELFKKKDESPMKQNNRYEDPIESQMGEDSRTVSN